MKFWWRPGHDLMTFCLPGSFQNIPDFLPTQFSISPAACLPHCLGIGNSKVSRICCTGSSCLEGSFRAWFFSSHRGFQHFFWFSLQNRMMPISKYQNLPWNRITVLHTPLMNKYMWTTPTHSHVSLHLSLASCTVNLISLQFFRGDRIRTTSFSYVLWYFLLIFFPSFFLPCLVYQNFAYYFQNADISSYPT